MESGQFSREIARGSPEWIERCHCAIIPLPSCPNKEQGAHAGSLGARRGRRQGSRPFLSRTRRLRFHPKFDLAALRTSPPYDPRPCRESSQETALSLSTPARRPALRREQLWGGAATKLAGWLEGSGKVQKLQVRPRARGRPNSAASFYMSQHSASASLMGWAERSRNCTLLW